MTGSPTHHRAPTPTGPAAEPRAGGPGAGGPGAGDPLLHLDGLTTSIPGDGNTPHLHLIQDVTLTVGPGEKVGVVGESGSGKSITMLSVMGLLPAGVGVSGGRIGFEGDDLTTLDERQFRRIRGARLAMVYQDPMSALNPVMDVGRQIAEGLRAHGRGRAEADETVVRVLGEVGIPDPARIARSYPHQLSGGMRQRVMIAMALALEPGLIIFDEATTALDVTIQAQILALVRRLHRHHNTAIVWVTHDLALVSNLVDRIVVMYGGRIVEQGPVAQVLTTPRHPYSAALLAALPDHGSTPQDQGGRRRLAQIPGRPPTLDEVQTGCPFRSRCHRAIDACHTMPEPTTEPGAGIGSRSWACWAPIGIDP